MLTALDLPQVSLRHSGGGGVVSSRIEREDGDESMSMRGGSVIHSRQAPISDVGSVHSGSSYGGMGRGGLENLDSLVGSVCSSDHPLSAQEVEAVATMENTVQRRQRDAERQGRSHKLDDQARARLRTPSPEPYLPYTGRFQDLCSFSAPLTLSLYRRSMPDL